MKSRILRTLYRILQGVGGVSGRQVNRVARSGDGILVDFIGDNVGERFRWRLRKGGAWVHINSVLYT